MEQYLKRCVEAHYAEAGETQRQRDLGITEDVQLVSDPMQYLGQSVLARIQAKERQSAPE
ncbi:MAG: hypothetical protein AAF609_15020 [Cyanobacteria bacterium P01_C01_bin.120]